jgi:hypothetical protein
MTKVTKRPSKPTKPPVKPEVPTDEPGQQPTPDADALSEVEGAMAALSGAVDQVAALMQSAGAFNQGGAFFRDKTDVDVGMDEVLRTASGKGAQHQTSLGMVLDHVAAVKSIDAQTVAHARNTNAEVLSNFENNANSFFGMLTRSNSTAQSALTQSEGLQTNNEVLTAAQLAEMIKALNEKVSAIGNAFAALVPQKKT